MSDWSAGGRVSCSPGCHLGRKRPGVELRPVFQARGERYPAALCGSGPGQSRLHLPLRLPPQQVRQDLALPARAGRPPRRSLLRLLGGRPRAAGRLRVALLRPGQGPARSLREVGLLPPGFRPGSGRASRVKRRQGTAGPARRRRRAVRLGRGPATPAPVGHHHLRVARPRVHEQPELRRESGAARHLRGAGREDSVSQRPGRHRGGTHARLPVRPAGRELLGLHAAELFRPPPRLRQPTGRVRPAQRVPRHGQGAPRRGHRGHPRRGLQPHGGRRPERAGLQLQGNRQQHLLPDVRQARKPLRELLRNREHPALLPTATSAR